MMRIGSTSKVVKSTTTATTSRLTTVLLWIGSSSMTTTILCCLCMMSMSCDHVMLMNPVAAAADDQQQVVGDYDNFQDYDSYCNNGPDALTEESGKSIPRTCFDVPYNSEKDNNDENAATTTMERCYYTYVPKSCSTDSISAENYNAETAVLNLPVVFDIHGLLSCPLWSTQYTGWLEKAQEECFVVVWPIGNTGKSSGATPGCWNLPGFLTAENRTENDVTTPPCCCFEGMDPDSALPVIPTEEPNDPLFLRMVIDSVVEAFQNENKTIATTTTQTTTTTTTTETQIDEVSNTTTAITTTAKVTIDRSRVYMSGHSNGCMASLTMAALYSDTVAAVCCHAGSLITPFPASASTTGTYIPVPVWMVHGMQDTVIPYEGTTLVDMAPFGSIGFWSTQDLVKYIAKKNECQNQEEYYDEEDDTTGNSTTFFYKNNNCTNNATVELVMMSAVGHVPYIQNSNPEVPIFEQGGANELSRVDTTALAWEFCSSHHNSYQRALQPQQDQNDEKEATEEDPFIATDVEKENGKKGSGSASVDSVEDGSGEGNSDSDVIVAGDGEKQDDSTSSSSAESSSSSSSTYSVAVELSSIFIIIMTMAV